MRAHGRPVPRRFRRPRHRTIAPRTRGWRPTRLTTHGVIVGMTGSGKTGLGVVLVEEVLLAGRARRCSIDPKGDLTNLCLTFPDLSPPTSARGSTRRQAKAAGQSPDDFAAAQAKTWTRRPRRLGLRHRTDRGAARRVRLHDLHARVARPARPINLVGSLQAPTTDDPEAVADEIEGFVSGLLGLVGVDADPLSSREHILLSNLVQHAWTSGAVARPADAGRPGAAATAEQARRVRARRVLPAEGSHRRSPCSSTACSRRRRSPRGRPGAPLDIERCCTRPTGRPRCAIVTTAHLSDDERQFVTSLLLGKLVTWMRRQSGTTDLRALLYMDEVAGYLPPTRDAADEEADHDADEDRPGRSASASCCSTQNPVDLDYKAISNAGTWMIGRLQTERDKERLLDGMSGATAASTSRRVGDTISGLDKREFVLRRAGERPARGVHHPMGDELPPRPAHARPDQAAATRRRHNAAAPRRRRRPHRRHHHGAAATPAADRAPACPASTRPRSRAPGRRRRTGHAGRRRRDRRALGRRRRRPGWPISVATAAGTVYEPAILATADLRYDEAKADLVLDQPMSIGALPASGAASTPLAPPPIASTESDLPTAAPPSVSYRLADAPIGDTKTLEAGRAGLDRPPRAGRRSTISVNKELKLYSQPNESPERLRRPLRDCRATPRPTPKKAEARRSRRTTGSQARRPARRGRGPGGASSPSRPRTASAATGCAPPATCSAGIFGSRREAAAASAGPPTDSRGTPTTSASTRPQGKVARHRAAARRPRRELAAESAAIDAKWALPRRRHHDVGHARAHRRQGPRLLLVWVPVP